MPGYRRDCVQKQLDWFPHQTTIRIAALDTPGYLTIPQLEWLTLTAIFPIWILFNDTTHKHILLHCLKKDDIDGFLYHAAMFQCEREVAYVSLELEHANDDQVAGETSTNESLANIQKVSARLKSCIQEDRAFEDRLRRAGSINGASCPTRSEFEKLAVRFSELDNALVQSFYRQTATLTAAGIQENLRQTTATNEQAQATLKQTTSMIALSWVAFIYAPLTFVTGIFGMNIKEIDLDNLLSWKLVLIIAVHLASMTLIVARMSR